MLQNDRNDLHLVQLVLATLNNVVTYDANNDEEQPNLPQDTIIQFTKSYIQNKKHVHEVVEYITVRFEWLRDFLLPKKQFSETDVNVRRAAIRFLTALLANSTEELRSIILEKGPKNFSKLLYVLQDQREVIQKDAVLLIEMLMRSNWNIKNLVVLANGFEYLLEILFNRRSDDKESSPSYLSAFRERSCIPRYTIFQMCFNWRTTLV